MRVVDTSVGIPFLWMKWGKKYRWISFECSLPVWWKPRIERYSFGKRMGWLFFAIGTGVVSKEQMQIINNVEKEKRKWQI